MKTVHIVDTGVLLNLLAVPGRDQQREQILEAYGARQARGDEFLVPLAVMFEVGNFIAGAADGQARRSAAERFVEFARGALDGKSPVVVTPFPTSADVGAWLAELPDRAMRGIGLVDSSLIHEFERQSTVLAKRRHVAVWTLDRDHLAAYTTVPERIAEA